MPGGKAAGLMVRSFVYVRCVVFWRRKFISSDIRAVSVVVESIKDGEDRGGWSQHSLDKNPRAS